MPDDFRFDVFLSHSSKDKPVVRDIAERLKKDGVKVWFDEWGLKPGDSIPAKIEEWLEHSRVLVLCMSANAFGSGWAQLESGTFAVSRSAEQGALLHSCATRRRLHYNGSVATCPDDICPADECSTKSLPVSFFVLLLKINFPKIEDLALPKLKSIANRSSAHKS